MDKALDITQENKELLEKLARIAEERCKVGKGFQQDVIRAQVEVSRVLQRLTVLRQRRRTLEAQFPFVLPCAGSLILSQPGPAQRSGIAASLGRARTSRSPRWEPGSIPRRDR